MKKNYLFYFLIAVVVSLTSACKSTYYELSPIPDYAPLDESVYDKSANISVESSESWIIHGLISHFQKYGYINTAPQGIPVKIGNLKVDYIVESSGFNVIAYLTKEGYVVTEQIVIMVRKPGRITPDGKLESAPPRLFQAFYRMTFPSRKRMIDQFKKEVFAEREKYSQEQIRLLSQGVLPYHRYHTVELYDNLFRNPRFREALNVSTK